ncbi:MAG: glucose-1-phosphate adenylyltransferase [Methylococcaceae bacterium]|nr:MAG: glucose-1-phosphate adenylyltransferase [Methylococcaceae bacterium]
MPNQRKPKQTQLDLEHYTELYDFAPVAYFTLDHAGTIRETNIAGAELLGLERPKLIGLHFSAFVAPTSLPRFHALLAEVFTSYRKETCDIELQLVGEVKRDVRIEAEATVTDDGQTCHVVLVDITDHIQAEKALKESEEKARQMADGVKDHFVFVLETEQAGGGHHHCRQNLSPKFIGDIAGHTYTLVLAGGRGDRLKHLTEWRAKPAVPFGGKLRIIDFVLSNCVNSGFKRVGVMTQYKAHSLIQHVQHGWNFLSHGLNEFIDVIPAQQRLNDAWYQGTADAVYQNLDIVRKNAPDYVLILGGDHIYKMDYRKLLADHVARSADLTIACIDMPLADAGRFGVMSVDKNWKITDFQEKPEHPVPIPNRPDRALVSMGIYVFNAGFLFDILAQDAQNCASSHDFGKDLIPCLVKSGRVFAHRFTDSCVNMVDNEPYWRDVGTVESYWDANMDLIQVVPALNLYDDDWPIWSNARHHLPPAKFVFDDNGYRGQAWNSLVTDGCIVSGATVRRSLLFSKARVGGCSYIEDSIVLPEAIIGSHVTLKRVIVEKRCRIPDGLSVGLDPVVDRQRFYVTANGITIVTAAMLGQ